MLFAHDVFPFERQILSIIEFIFNHFVMISFGFIVVIVFIVWYKVRK